MNAHEPKNTGKTRVSPTESTGSFPAHGRPHQRAMGMAETRLGLPAGIRVCLFDLDGVLTETATLHAKAWRRMFDGFLSARARSSGRPFVPFDVARDYSLVDGKLRDDGTRSFLASRSIQLPEGTGDDPATAETIQGLGKLKNGILFALMREQGVEAYPGSVRYVRAVRDAGPRTAVVSSSENCHEVLIAAGIADLFDARIDGVVAAELHLAAEVGHLRLALDYAAEAALMDLQDIEHNLKNIFKA